MSLGTRLRELREAAGISQEQIAAIAGVSRNAVSQWESDRTRPATQRLALIARALDVALEDLLSPGAQLRGKLIATTTKLFERLEAEEVTIGAICAACGIKEPEFEAAFHGREELLLEMLRNHEERKLAAVREAPPVYGTLATRLKYLIRQFYMHDLAHRNFMRATISSSWVWDATLERSAGQLRLGTHELIVSYFDDAAAQGQIDSGNFRAASNLILAAYLHGLRKAVFESLDPDRTITFLEPQIMIVLRGFNFRIVPGLAEDSA